MPLTLEQFSAQLTGGDLLSAEEVARLREEHRPADAEQFARLLVKQKLLTAYQAQQAYAGKANSLVLGNYVLLDKLGQGGMGMVLKARHRRMNRLVALKILSPAVTKTPEAMKRFQREVEAAARLHHPNIVTAHDADEVKGTHFLVMEYVEGTDLSALTKKKGPLPVDQAITCITQAARGLEFAHKHGIIHRDIKPANLLLDQEGSVKILDMGLARIEGETGAQSELTSTGAVMGTVDYMAPEQALSTKSADARSDIYSLGVTLWYLLTGRPVYEGDSLMARLIGHRESPIPSLKGIRGEVPAALDDIFRRMLAKQPQDRFQSMTEVLSALETCRAGGSSSSSTPSFSVAPSEESKLSEFMGILGGAADPTDPTRTSRTPVATKTAPPSGSEYEATVTSASAAEGTDPQTLTNLSRAIRPTAADGGTNRPSRSSKWIIGGVGALVVIATIVFLRAEKNAPGPPPVPVAQGQFAPVASSPSKLSTITASDPSPEQFALEFDGKTSRVECPPLDNPGREFTVEAWVVSSPEESADTLPAYQLGESSVSMNSRGPYWVLDFWTTTGQWQGVTDNQNSPRGVLTHVAATMSDQECRLYLDGQHKSTRPASVAMGDVEEFWSQLATAPLTIGSRKLTPEGKRRSFKGQIQQLRVSSTLRYRDRFAPPSRFESDPQTLALYRFDEGKGDVLQDTSGHDRHGRIFDAKWVAVSSRTPAAPLARAEKGEPALEFDGVNDYVDVGPVSAQDLRELTLELWLTPNAESKSSGESAVSWGDLAIRHNPSDKGNDWVATYRMTNGRYIGFSDGRPVVVPGSPTHMAYVANPERSDFFINGTRIAGTEWSKLEGTLWEAFQAEARPRLVLGGDRSARSSGATNWGALKGAMHAFRLSRSARYLRPFTPQRELVSDDKTLIFYRFDEGTGDTLRDSSGNGRDGKIFGATWKRSTPISPSKTAPPTSRNPNAALRFAMGRQTDYVELPPAIQFDDKRPGTIEVWILDWALERGTPFYLVGDQKLIKFQFDEPNRSRLVVVPEVLEGEPSRSLQITVPTADLRPGPLHLAACWNGQGGYRLYVNGKRFGSAKNSQFEYGVYPASTIGYRSSAGFDTNLPQAFTLGQVRISRVDRYSASFAPARNLEPDGETLALYRFDEGEGDVIHDASGNGHHGTRGGATWVKRPDLSPAFLDTATALKFDGVDDRVDLPPIPLTDARELTFEAVVELETPNPNQGALFRTCQTSMKVGNGLESYFSMGRRSGDPVVTTHSTDLPLGRPVHLAGVWNGKRLEIYVDGQLQGWNEDGDQVLVRNGSNTIGDHSTTPKEPFGGKFYRLRITKKALYDGPFKPNLELPLTAETVALYRFEEGTGDALKDSSANGLHGKIVGPAWVVPPKPAGSPSPGAGESPDNRALEFDGKGHVQLPPIDFTKLDALTLEATVTVRDPPGKDQNDDLVGTYFSDKERYGIGLMAKERGLILEVGTQTDKGVPVQEIVVPGSPWGKGPHRVAATVDRKGKSIAFFVDGRLIDRKPFVGEFNGGPTPLMLGADPGLGGRPNLYFAGQIDEVRISDIVRYTDNYEPAERFEPDDHTLALYHCDEGSGEVLTDSSVHGRHGKVVKSRWVAATPALADIQPVASSTAPAMDPVAHLNSAGQDDAYPWLSPDATRIDYTRESEGRDSAIYSASRESADQPFGPPRRELSARQLVLSADRLYGVGLPADYAVGKTLVETARTSIGTPWSEPKEIASLKEFSNAKSPWLSENGLTLVFQRPRTTSPISGSPTEFVLSRRESRTSPWPSPELLPMSPDPALNDAITWPHLSPDLRTLCFCIGGTRAPRVFFATRTGTEGAFGNYQPVMVNGQPLTGRAPRWVSDREELYLSRDADPAVKESDLQIVRGIRPRN